MNKRRPRWFLKGGLSRQQEESRKCENRLVSLKELERPALISSLLVALKECIQGRDLETGRRAHELAIDKGVLSNIYIANNLINMYGKCGSMVEAQKVFDRMDRRSVVSWNSIIQGYVENGEFERGLEFFHQMKFDFASVPDARSYVAALTACTSLATSGEASENNRWLEVGKQLHSEAILSRCCNTIVENSVINMYGKCGSLALARNVFGSMAQRSVVSWNVLLQSYVENGENELALEIFNRIHGCNPDERSFVAALTACASLGARKDETLPVWLDRGREIHSRALKNGCPNVVLETALIAMYSKCSSMAEARRVFDGMRRRDVVSWTCLIQGYADSGESRLALEIFELMVGTQAPDAWTYVAALGACGALLAAGSGTIDRVEFLEKGRSIYSRAVASSSCNTFVENAMIHLFARCGSLAEARRLFDAMMEPSSVTLKLLLQGYADHGHPELSLGFLLEQPERMRLDSGVLSSAVEICGDLMAEECGRGFHSEILRAGFGEEPLVVSCLIEFYGKCGRIPAARAQFDSSREVDIRVWNSLLSGYSLRGQANEFFRSFQEMREQMINPNSISFTHLLTVCSHAGLTFTARKWFGSMETGFGVAPDLVHYTCMVDLLARGNRVDEALKLVESMPFTPNTVTWTAILSGCWKWGNVEAGRFAFDELLKLDCGIASAYNLMANLTIT